MSTLQLTKLFIVGSVLLEALCATRLTQRLCNSDFITRIVAIGLASVIVRPYLNLRLLGHQAKPGMPVYLDLQEAVGIV